MAVATSCSTPVTNRTAIADFRLVTFYLPQNHPRQLNRFAHDVAQLWTRLDWSTPKSNSRTEHRRTKVKTGHREDVRR
jgi:hypothetical protein